MPLDPTHSLWIKTGCTASAAGVLTEDATNNRHSFYQDVQALVDAGLGTSAIMKANINPVGRVKAWMGCRQNNGNFMASFDLTGAGSVESQGSSVSSASIVADGIGGYDCKVVFSGTYSTTATVFAVGALIAAGAQTYTGTSIAAITITSMQLIKGTQDFAYITTTDRTKYLDLLTADGSQDATLPGSNLPDILNPEYIISAGATGLTIADFTYDLTELTVYGLVDWSGDTSTTKVIAGHWDAGVDDSWLMVIDTTGHFRVSISDDGTTTYKDYVAVTPLDTNEFTLCTFTWDGTSLKLYYNDIELTGAELTKTTDGAVSGALHNSSAIIGANDLYHGKYKEFGLLDGAATGAEVAAIAAGFGVSGLPDGGGGSPPGGGGDIPTTTQGMVDYLTGKGLSESNIFYVNNSTGNDSNTGTSSLPWLTIQKAARTLTAGQGVIIQGAAGPFYETVTLRASGSAGNLIWFVGDPENNCIIDGSEVFSPTWTDQGSNRWRAPYALTRDYTRLADYHNTNCTTSPPCIHESVAIAHQMIYNKEQLVRVSQASVPATFATGTCFFEKGTGSYETPQYVWCRLPGDVNPNGVTMRNTRTNAVTADNPSGGNHLWDWHSDSPSSLWNGHTGGVGSTRATGRNYIGMANLHFRGSVDCSRDIGSVNIRGHDWFLEWCSFVEMNAYGFGVYGYNHTIVNCKTKNNGQGSFRGEYLQHFNAGTTSFQLCEFRNNNIHTHPIAWEAGHKYSNTGNGGKIEHIDCLFINDTDSRWIGAGGLWWDIANGASNPAEDAYLVERCVFDNIGRWALFFENNTYYATVRNCAIFQTQQMEAGGAQVAEAAGIKFSGSGKSLITQNAIVSNEGTGFHAKTEGGGASKGQNFCTITNNVFVENAGDAAVDGFLRTNFIVGNSSSENVNTNTIDGNVFTKGSATWQFTRNDSGSYSPDTDTLSTFEGWHGGSGNVIEATATNVVSSVSNRKTFFVTSGGSYPTKGPTALVHPEDIAAFGWTIPT